MTSPGGAEEWSGSRPFVGHLVARDGPPARLGMAYDYLLAGDGVYLATENAFMSVRVPVARATVRGLPPLYAACSLTRNPLPLHLWHSIVRAARATATAGRELLMAVEYVDGQQDGASTDGGYRLVFPRQLAGPLSVVYRPFGQAVLEIHSHHHLPARFSATDDADEQRLCLYGVIGRLDRERPQVAIRVGAYGYYQPVPWETVFAGDLETRRTLHDAYFDGPYVDLACGIGRAQAVPTEVGEPDKEESRGDEPNSWEG